MRKRSNQVFTYVVTLLLVLGAAGGGLWYAVQNERIDLRWLVGSSSQHGGQLPSVTHQLPAAYSRGDGNYDELFGGSVFVGDSITVGMSAYGYLASYQTIAKTGLTIEHARTTKIKTDYGTMTAPKAVELLKPTRIYVMLGTNGVSFLTLDTMLTQYEELLKELEESSPDSTFFLLSIPPVSKAKETSSAPIKNADIREYNEAIKKLAEDRGHGFIDIHAALVDENGVLPKRRTSDGMHLEKDVYPLVLDCIYETTKDQSQTK